MTSHSGLQAVSAIGSSIKTFLGPNLRAKCIIDDTDPDNNMIVTNAVDCLQILDIQHPVGQLFNSTCQSHHKRYGTSTTTLACVAAFWAKAVIGLQDQGVPIPVIVDAISEILEKCISQVTEFAIPVEIVRQEEEGMKTRVEEEQEKLDCGSEHTRHVIAKETDDREIRDYAEFMEIEFERNLAELGEVHDQDMKQGVKDVLGCDKTEDECNDKAENDDDDDDDDDDDISWYFGGRMPSPPKFPDIPEMSFLTGKDGMNASVVGHVSDKNSATHLGGADESKDFDFGIIENESWVAPVKPVGFVQTSQHCHEDMKIRNNVLKQVIDDYDDDDDFDSCFTEGQYEERSTHQDTWKTSFSKDLQCSETVLLNQLSGLQAESIPHSKHSVSSKAGNASDELKPGQFFPIEVDLTDPNSASIEQSPHTERQKVRAHNLERMLADRLKAKSTEKTKAIHNLSRHFTSTQGIVDQKMDSDDDRNDFEVNRERVQPRHTSECDETVNMEEKSSTPAESGVMKNPIHEETTKIDKLLSKLRNSGQGMKGLRQSNLSSIENNSRHFRTIESIVDQQNLEAIAKSDGDTVKKLSSCTKKTSFENLDFEKSQTGRRPSLTAIQKRSRHFRCEDDEIRNDGHGVGVSQCTDISESITDIDELGKNLSHGKHEMMTLVVDAYRQQIQRHSGVDKFVFDLNLIHTCSITGPSITQCHLEDGLIIEMELRYLQSVHSARHREHSILLINGDVKPSFRHTGHKESVAISVVQYSANGRTAEHSWFDGVLQTLCQVECSVILMKGVADDRLHDYCMANEILIIENVKYSALVTLAVAADANILTYITDARWEDTGRPVSLACWESGWQPRTGVRTQDLKRTGYVRLTAESPIQTLIVCAPSTTQLTGLQYDFLTCAHRLQDALTFGKVLPGGGITELRLIQYIQTMKEETKEFRKQSYGSVIAEAVQSVLEDFLVAVTLNSGHHSHVSGIKHLIHQASLEKDPKSVILSEVSDPQGIICDCLSAKTQAWKAAWSLVRLVAQCDMHITTGIESKASVQSWKYREQILGVL